jgi:hypothetical protein
LGNKEYPGNHFRVSRRRKAFWTDVLLPTTHYPPSTINFSTTYFEAVPKHCDRELAQRLPISEFDFSRLAAP